jgi:hypothetical protein
VSIANTGGTDADAKIQKLWGKAAKRFGVVTS